MTTLTLHRSGLIVTRRPGEAIMIGDDVTITIASVQGSSVRVLITAPREIPVHREEVYKRIKAETAPKPTQET